MSDPLPPAFVKFMRQNTVNTDCVPAALAMLCGVSYEVALAACVEVKPDVLTNGMGTTWRHVKAAALKLGATTRVQRAFNIDEQTGLLNVKSRTEDHVCFLWAGRIVDGNGEMWLDADDYLAYYRYTPLSLLVRD